MSNLSKSAIQDLIKVAKSKITVSKVLETEVTYGKMYIGIIGHIYYTNAHLVNNKIDKKVIHPEAILMLKEMVQATGVRSKYIEFVSYKPVNLSGYYTGDIIYSELVKFGKELLSASKDEYDLEFIMRKSDIIVNVGKFKYKNIYPIEIDKPIIEYCSKGIGKCDISDIISKPKKKTLSLKSLSLLSTLHKYDVDWKVFLYLIMGYNNLEELSISINNKVDLRMPNPLIELIVNLSRLSKFRRLHLRFTSGVLQIDKNIPDWTSSFVSIPPLIANLKNLIALKIEDIIITTYLQPFLDNLSNIDKLLELNIIGVNSTISKTPESHLVSNYPISIINKFNNLTSLSIHNIRLNRDLFQFFVSLNMENVLNNLTRLSIKCDDNLLPYTSSTEFIQIPYNRKNLVNLRMHTFELVRMSRLSKKLKKLNHLDISGNYTKGVSGKNEHLFVISKLINLTNLSIRFDTNSYRLIIRNGHNWHTRTTGKLKYIAELLNLIHLRIVYEPGVVELPEEVSKLQKLKSLEVYSRTLILNKGIKKLRNLETIVINTSFQIYALLKDYRATKHVWRMSGKSFRRFQYPKGTILLTRVIIPFNWEYVLNSYWNKWTNMKYVKAALEKSFIQSNVDVYLRRIDGNTWVYNINGENYYNADKVMTLFPYPSPSVVSSPLS